MPSRCRVSVEATSVDMFGRVGRGSVSRTAARMAGTSAAGSASLVETITEKLNAPVTGRSDQDYVEGAPGSLQSDAYSTSWTTPTMTRLLLEQSLGIRKISVVNGSQPGSTGARRVSLTMATWAEGSTIDPL